MDGRRDNELTGLTALHSWWGTNVYQRDIDQPHRPFIRFQRNHHQSNRLACYGRGKLELPPIKYDIMSEQLRNVDTTSDSGKAAKWSWRKHDPAKFKVYLEATAISPADIALSQAMELASFLEKLETFACLKKFLKGARNPHIGGLKRMWNLEDDA